MVCGPDYSSYQLTCANFHTSINRCKNDNFQLFLNILFFCFGAKKKKKKILLSLHNAIRPRGHSRHVALSSNPSMLIDKSKR